jgi:E3 ubiquitin-protein ligase DOA10
MKKECRICFDTDGAMIAPCLCNGTSKYVHISCLERWRTTINNDNFIKCPTCKYVYRTDQKRDYLRFLFEYKTFIVKVIPVVIVLIVIMAYEKFIDYLIDLLDSKQIIINFIIDNVTYIYSFIILFVSLEMFFSIYQTITVTIFSFLVTHILFNEYPWMKQWSGRGFLHLLSLYTISICYNRSLSNINMGYILMVNEQIISRIDKYVNNCFVYLSSYRCVIKDRESA